MLCAMNEHTATSGSVSPADSGRLSKGRPATYWCTWATQAATLARNRASGLLKFPDDLGVPGTRDNLNEEILFGPKGWSDYLPEHRQDMFLLLDDGWDVPYGATGNGDGIRAFGSLVLDRARFPLPGAGDANRDRLRELARRIEDKGWKGLGIWVACQASGERNGDPLPEDALKEDLRRKLDESAYAGVRYWKVDWGIRCGDVRYRRLMSEMKESLYPELVIEHCRCSSNALNGQAVLNMDVEDGSRYVGRTGRIFGEPSYDSAARYCKEILSFADVFRTYDSGYPLTTATMLERAAWTLQIADKSSSRVVVNTEDEPLIAAGLGLELGMMRSPCMPNVKIMNIRPLQRCIAEDMRCVAWQQVAPPFGSDTAIKTLHSDESIREEWHFARGAWFTGYKEVTCFQVAPARIARGLPLPEVEGTDGEAPYVVGSRHPNGALAFAALPLLDPVKLSWTPKATVRFNAALEAGVPVCVFGRFGSLVLNDRTEGGRIVARDILGGDAVDLTAQCRRENGKVVLPGDALAKIGASQNPPGDDSEPGALVEVLRD